MTNTTPAPGIDMPTFTVDEQIEWLEKNGNDPLGVLATLRKFKEITEAPKPEPVAWTNKKHDSLFYDTALVKHSEAFKSGELQPLYGPDLLAYAERMRVERDALIALMREPDEEMYAAAVNHMRAVFAGGLSADINGTFKAMSAVALRKAGVA